MYIDVTPYIMKDPCTREVRAPTERERRGNVGRKKTHWDELDVGGYVPHLSRYQARYGIWWLRTHGREGKSTKTWDGTYRVERIR